MASVPVHQELTARAQTPQQCWRHRHESLKLDQDLQDPQTAALQKKCWALVHVLVAVRHLAIERHHALANSGGPVAIRRLAIELHRALANSGGLVAIRRLAKHQLATHQLTVSICR